MKFLTPSDQLVVERLVTLIYGQPGIGKTSIAQNLTQRTLLIDTNMAAHRAVNRNGTVARMEDWGEFLQYVDSPVAFDQLKKSYDHLVFDTIQDTLELIAQYAMAKNRSLVGNKLQRYGAIGDEFRRIFYKLKAHFHLTFTAHQTESDHPGGKDAIMWKPKITGQSSDLIFSFCDLYGYLYFDNGERVLDFNQSDTHYGKNPAQLPSMNVPKYDSSSSDRYIEFCRGILIDTLEYFAREDETKKEQDRKMRELKEAVDSEFRMFTTAVEAIDDITAEKFTELFRSATTTSKLKDKSSKTNLWAMIKAKASELGFLYDRESKTFVPQESEEVPKESNSDSDSATPEESSSALKPGEMDAWATALALWMRKAGTKKEFVKNADLDLVVAHAETSLAGVSGGKASEMFVGIEKEDYDDFLRDLIVEKL